MNIFAPPIVAHTRGNVLSIPIHQYINYAHFEFVKESDGVEYPPLMVLLEGDEARNTPADFLNKIDENFITSESVEFDDHQFQENVTNILKFQTTIDKVDFAFEEL